MVGEGSARTTTKDNPMPIPPETGASAIPERAPYGISSLAQPTLEPQELRHDVMNSLTVALGYAGMLRRWLPTSSDPRLFRALAAIEDDVRRAYRLLAPREGRADDPDLRAVLGRALSQTPARRCGDVRLRMLTDASLVGDWDPLRIERVLANLIDNAAKYSAPGSPIEIELSAEGGYAQVAVRDEGIGIAATELEGVFHGRRSSEARTVANGTGIGLPLCRRLVTMAGGRLLVSSTPAVGSVFLLILPLADVPGTPNAAVVEAEAIHAADG
jgi:signal transduction histidine kinase